MEDNEPQRYQQQPLNLNEEEKKDLEKLRIEFAALYKDIYSQMSDAFLIRFLRARKNNVEDACKTLEMFYRVRPGLKPVFEVPYSSAEKLFGKNSFIILKQRDEKGTHVLYTKMGSLHVEDFTIYEMKLAVVLLVEEMTYIEETQKKGCCFILDFRDVTFSQAKHLASTISFKEIKFFAACFQNAYPARIKKIFLLNLPFLLASILNLFKLLLKAKLRKRIFTGSESILTNNLKMEDNFLPVSLGGTVPDEEASDAELCRNALKNYQYFQDTRKYGYTNL